MLRFDSFTEPLAQLRSKDQVGEVVRVKDHEHASISRAFAPAPFFSELRSFARYNVIGYGPEHLAPCRLRNRLALLLQALDTGCQFDKFLLNRFNAHDANLPAGASVCKLV